VLRDARLDLPVFHGADDRDEGGHSDESQDHSLFHETSPCLDRIDIANLRASGFKARERSHDPSNHLQSKEFCSPDRASPKKSCGAGLSKNRQIGGFSAI
jgi:hypothetical protein